MKKTMATILALLMVFSLVPLAFAENETADNSTGDADPGDNQTGDADGGDDNQTGDADGGDDNQTADPTGGDDNQTADPTGGDDNQTDDNQTADPTGGDDNQTDDNQTGDADGGDDGDDNETGDGEEDGAGITPDSWLWGLERAIERVSLSLTLGKSAKAKKGLAHAQERLMEVKAMIQAKRFGAAADAQEAHDETMEGVEDNVEGLGNGDALGELETEVELEKALNEHRTMVQKIGNLKLKVKGLSFEEMAQVDNITSSLQSSASKVEVEVQVKKNKTKIKLKAKEGLTDDELAGIASQIEEAVARGEKAKIQIKAKDKKDKKGGDDDENETDDDDEDEEEDDDEDEDDDEEKGNKGKGKNKKDDDDEGDDE